MIRHKWGTQWPDDQEVGWHRMRSASYTWRRQEAQVSRFSLKTDGHCLLVVWPQNYCDSFLVWASKPRSTVWWFVHQNHYDGFLFWASKPSGRRFIDLHHKTDERMKTVWEQASTSGGLFCREASRASVSQFCLKTSEWATTGGAHSIVAEVALKWSERWSVQWHRMWHSGSQSKLPFIRYNFSFSQQGHSSLLVFTINRTIELLWEVSLSHPPWT
jgi:hypothetical protein